MITDRAGLDWSTPRSADRIAAAYRQSGFAILSGLLAHAEVAALNDEMLRLVRGELGSIEGAITAAGLTDEELPRSLLCAHMPHKISPLFRTTMRHPALLAALNGIIGPDVKAMQSMAFIKAAGKPGQAWHQDETHIPTVTGHLTAAWIALDAADPENGGLRAIPGSHRDGVLYPDRDIDDARFDCTKEAYRFPYSDDGKVSRTALGHTSGQIATAAACVSDVDEPPSARGRGPWIDCGRG